MAIDPALDAMLRKASAATGADYKALLATTLVESGGRFGAVGDGGTSYGPFQFHKGGALGNHDSKWANSYDAVLNRAQEFKRLGVHGGKGAAAVQRPADQAGYAKKVDAALSGVSGVDLNAPVTGVDSKGSVTTPKTTSGATGITDPDASHIAQRRSQLPLIQSLMQRAGVNNPGLTMLADFQAKGMSTAGLTGAAPANAPGTDIPLTPGGDPSNPVTPAVPGSTNPTDLAKQVAGPQAAKVVGLAQQYLGTPYKWGGADPKNGFDCSGFAQYLYKKNGVNIPRTTYEQVKSGVGVDRKSLQAGDLVFFNTSGANSHEGIYLGDGKFIHAPHTGDVVKISNLNDPYYTKHFSTARRVTGNGK